MLALSSFFQVWGHRSRNDAFHIRGGLSHINERNLENPSQTYPDYSFWNDSKVESILIVKVVINIDLNI